MIVHNMPQGTPEWFAARLGIPTASNFDKIITPSGKPSTQAQAYMNTLLAEWLTGLPGGMEPNEWMQRGTELEPEARAYYEVESDYDVEQVGFVTDDEGRYGCSPDGLLGADGLLEIKCPAPHTHVGYLLDADLPAKYVPQVQGQLLVCERKWCDFLSYHPSMPPAVVRAERDGAFQKALLALLREFVATLEARRDALTAKGYVPA